LLVIDNIWFYNLGLFFRDKKQISSMSREEEEKFNQVLHKNKMNVFVSNTMFKEVMKNVGVKSAEDVSILILDQIWTSPKKSLIHQIWKKLSFLA